MAAQKHMTVGTMCRRMLEHQEAMDG